MQVFECRWAGLLIGEDRLVVLVVADLGRGRLIRGHDVVLLVSHRACQNVLPRESDGCESDELTHDGPGDRAAAALVSPRATHT